QLATEHACVVKVPAQEHLVHATQVLFVHEVVVAQQLAIDLHLGSLELDLGWLLGFVGHRASSLPSDQTDGAQSGANRTLRPVPVAQWTERLPSKQRVAGSNPAGDAICLRSGAEVARRTLPAWRLSRAST